MPDTEIHTANNRAKQSKNTNAIKLVGLTTSKPFK
jgi:hypothetical protein